jgi:hypothetical protein
MNEVAWTVDPDFKADCMALVHGFDLPYVRQHFQAKRLLKKPPKQPKTKTPPRRKPAPERHWKI